MAEVLADLTLKEKWKHVKQKKEKYYGRIYILLTEEEVKTVKYSLNLSPKLN